ncbi:TIGR04104 family putative zinc finger protein [Flavimarina sp. Hel_I_48]|uniref:TIGR04104 family putative zinc finger protein n=1 Tax=Flavimarina sp. Hel_I_48 TaxID=1392488 RepID=UPI0004DF9EE4|nr:TIGR04104 family putative zinc finger protein [Flavimarina sp. Hel_I_48]
MDTCKKCKNELGFWQVLKSFWLNYRSIKCFFCGAVQQHADRNKVVGGAVIFLTLLFTARLLFTGEFNEMILLGYLFVTAFTGIIFSLGAVPFLRFNILQTQRFDNKRNR